MTYLAAIGSARVLHRPQLRQWDSRICCACRPLAPYISGTQAYDCSRNFRINPPTPRLKHFRCPKVSDCNRAHAIKTGLKSKSSIDPHPILMRTIRPQQLLERRMLRDGYYCIGGY